MLLINGGTVPQPCPSPGCRYRCPCPHFTIVVSVAAIAIHRPHPLPCSFLALFIPASRLPSHLLLSALLLVFIPLVVRCHADITLCHHIGLDRASSFVIVVSAPRLLDTGTGGAYDGQPVRQRVCRQTYRQYLSATLSMAYASAESV